MWWDGKIQRTFRSDFKAVMAGCDVVIATTGVPGLIKKDMVRRGRSSLTRSTRLCTSPSPGPWPGSPWSRGSTGTT